MRTLGAEAQGAALGEAHGAAHGATPCQVSGPGTHGVGAPPVAAAERPVRPAAGRGRGGAPRGSKPSTYGKGSPAKAAPSPEDNGDDDEEVFEDLYKELAAIAGVLSAELFESDHRPSLRRHSRRGSLAVSTE
mmetsp:Transcript_7366/g.20711  ORF Transcript_7366/g.20711 Transcript_7366/m.20711 type:complete len:133 (+) Transcript_7366:106-504(+)